MQLDEIATLETAQPPQLGLRLPNPTLCESPAGAFQLQRYRLTDGQRAGVELLVVDSGGVRAAICPTRGMSLWKAHIGGIDYGWDSPVAGPIHPSFVPIDEPRGIGWLDGFDELLVRCGLRSFGAPEFDQHGRVQWPVHGRIGNTPAQNLQISVDPERSQLHVRAEVLETRFLQYNLRLEAQYTFSFGEPLLEITDTVTNAGGTPTSMQLLYHINVGSPVLEGGAKLHLGCKRVVARDARSAEDLEQWQVYRDPTAGYVEQVYFSESAAGADGWAKALLTNAAASRGLAVHYLPKTLPYFSQWKNTAAAADGYVTGLEPATGFPNPRSFEESQGRTVALAAGESRQFSLKLEGISATERISELSAELDALRGQQPVELAGFQSQWCTPR